jgi:hypothetical protein
MKITSKVTYVLPFLVLLIPSWYLSGLLYYPLSFFDKNYELGLIFLGLFTIVDVVLLVLAFAKLAPKVNPIVFKISLVAFPAVVSL